MNKLPPDVEDHAVAIDPELRRRIEERAYSLWESDGRPEGRDLDYWLQAEQEVVGQSTPGEEALLAGIDQGVGRRSSSTTDEAADSNRRARRSHRPTMGWRVRDETGPQ
jgi:Protein of unknown function (DUF2934)